jgi:hypothetical protein
MEQFVRCVMKKPLAILVLLVNCAAAQVVSGNIINSASNIGIARVTVHLESTSESNDAYDALTDALGHFAFARVKPGTYQFSYYASAFARTEGSTFPQIHVTAGGGPLTLEGRMTALPTIAGRVVDANRNGVAGALVSINGPSAKMVATTDASGKFEQHLPQSGPHSVSVTPPPDMKQPEPEPGSGQPRVWTPVYYPGVTIPEAASKITVRPGDQILGIELKLLAVSAHVVRGVLLNPDGTPAADVIVALNIDEPARDRDVEEHPIYESKTNSEGGFEFPPVADGDWRISAGVEQGGVKLRAQQWVEMAGHNMDNVRVRLAAPFDMQGRVLIVARDGAVVPKPPSVSLIAHAGRIRRESGAASWMLQPETMARAGFQRLLFDKDGALTADADQDGSLIFRSVYPDSYRIAPMSAPAGYYLDSVRVGETDVAAKEVSLSNGALPITVVYKAGGGVVHGSVEKCASGAVLLIPADAEMRWFGFIHSVRCDAKDHYEITAVRPGDYYAVAFAGRDSAPSLAEGILRQARRITVKLGEAVTADVSPIAE